MAKYRAILLVPSIVEIECDGTVEEATKQVRDIADGMGRAFSFHPKQHDTPNAWYEPKLIECVCVAGTPKPPVKLVA